MNVNQDYYTSYCENAKKLVGVRSEGIGRLGGCEPRAIEVIVKKNTQKVGGPVGGGW